MTLAEAKRIGQEYRDRAARNARRCEKAADRKTGTDREYWELAARIYRGIAKD